MRGRLRARVWTLVLVCMGLAFGGCSPRGSADTDGAWALPFPLDPDNGCQSIATPFSVANPWDWAHEAIDFACASGTPALSVRAGVVRRVEWVEVGGVGQRARIEVELDGLPLRVEYVNLSRALAEEGQIVAEGDILGFTATGLQLSVWDEDAERYVDPTPYFGLPSAQ